MWEKRSTHSLLIGIQPPWEHGVEIPQKGRSRATIRYSCSTSEHISKDCTSYCQDTCSLTLIAALFKVARKWNQCGFPPTGDG